MRERNDDLARRDLVGSGDSSFRVGDRIGEFLERILLQIIVVTSLSVLVSTRRSMIEGDKLDNMESSRSPLLEYRRFGSSALRSVYDLP